MYFRVILLNFNFGFNSIKHLQTKNPFSLIMRKKRQPRKQESLRKHGAETGLQQRTQPPP